MSTGQRRARRIREESDSNNRTINPRNPSRLQSRSHSVSLGGDERERMRKKGRTKRRRRKEDERKDGSGKRATLVVETA